MKDKWDDIKVNRRKGDDIHFESNFVQSIYNSIGFLKDEATEILKDIDSAEFKKNIDEFDIDEFGQNAITHFSEFVDDISEFKDGIVDSNDIPESVKETSKNVKRALNKDADYIRRARKRLDSKPKDNKVNLRVIALCNKAIDLNPDNYESYYLKGLALINFKRYDEAIEELINSLALNENADARLAIAKANRLNNDYDDAINVYDSVLKRYENSYEAYLGKALTYFALDDYTNADEEFKKANSIKVLDEESKKIWDECLKNLA